MRLIFKRVVCIVIGYSFRDEAANGAFLDAFKTNRRLKLVYVSGDETTMNLSRVPEIAAKAVPIERRFGIRKPSLS